MDELKHKLSESFTELADGAVASALDGSSTDLPRDDIAKRVDLFIRDVTSFINLVKTTEVQLADDKLKNEYEEDWLSYRDDRLEELRAEAVAIGSNYTWNKAQSPFGSMTLQDRLMAGKDALDARSGLHIPVPGEGRELMDGETNPGQTMGSVS